MIIPYRVISVVLTSVAGIGTGLLIKEGVKYVMLNDDLQELEQKVKELESKQQSGSSAGAAASGAGGGSGSRSS